MAGKKNRGIVSLSPDPREPKPKIFRCTATRYAFANPKRASQNNDNSGSSGNRFLPFSSFSDGWVTDPARSMRGPKRCSVRRAGIAGGGIAADVASLFLENDDFRTLIESRAGLTVRLMESLPELFEPGPGTGDSPNPSTVH